MTKTVTISGYVYEVEYGYSTEKEYRFFGIDTMGDKHYTLIGPVQFDYTIPEDFNPTAQKLAALEKEKQAVRSAYLQKVREIEERISNLQALEMTVEA
jgi:hypothetical protein